MNGIDQPSSDRRPATSRRRMLTFGVPAAVAASVLAALPFIMGSGADSIRTSEASPTIATSATTTILGRDDPFSNGTTVEATVDSLPPRPTTTPPTTVPPVVETLPEQPAQPIAPPADPRAAEDRIELGSISIPKLGVEEPLLSGITLTTLDQGPGHWPGTALPGEVGNVVVAAHRTSHGAPFRNIDQLVAGDTVLFTTAAGPSEYTVVGTEVVNPDAMWIVDPTDTPTATLFACHPPGSVAQRIVVHLELAA